MMDRFIEFVFADHDNNAFVPLVRYGFQTPQQQQTYWDNVPSGPDDGVLIADRHDPDGVSDNKFVTREWLEGITGKALQTMIAEGRKHNETLLTR
jgi:hypothetical protein